MNKRPFGSSRRGEAATLYIFENSHGTVMEVTDFGATLRALRVPTGDGLLDVVLGYDSPAAYEGPGGTFFGATVGRNANRIGGASIVINGVTYPLDKNDKGRNNLHSGLDFQSFRVWDVKETGDSFITFSLHSPDGDQGYPGELDMEVTYTLTDDNALRIDYYGVPRADTLINYTNHSYFNLNGHSAGDILGHSLRVDADRYTPTDAESIPTGEILPVEGTPMDFRVKKKVGRDIGADFEPLILGRGYDHNWCLNNGGAFAKVAELTGDISGITMEVYTDLPGVQIYTANYVLKEAGKEGAVYMPRQGICFETQHYPDALNHPNFPSPLYRAGEIYRTATVFRFL